MPSRSSKSKAGISWPVQERTSDPLAQYFQPGSLSWHYNWNKNWKVILPETSPDLSLNAEFVPMIFAPGYFDNEFKVQEGYTHILGFNEPDHSDPAVAQLATPEKAAEEWKKIAALRSPQVKLISPAVAGDINWLKLFMDILPPNARPDCIAVHVYSTTFDAFKAKIEEFWNTFHLPIWVTEFAMTSFDPNVPPPTNMQQVHDFMGQTTAWLDETDYIAQVKLVVMFLTEEADMIGDMRGLEPVEMERIFTGYILSIDSWMSKGGLLLWAISTSMEVTIDNELHNSGSR